MIRIQKFMYADKRAKLSKIQDCPEGVVVTKYHGENVSKMLLFMNRTRLATATSRGNVNIYDVNKPRLPAIRAEPHTGLISGLINLVDDLLVTGGEDGYLCAIEGRTGEIGSSMEVKEKCRVTALAKLDDTRMVVATQVPGLFFCENTLIAILRFSDATFMIQYRFPHAHSRAVNQVLGDFQKFVTCANDKKATIWTNGKPGKTYKHKGPVLSGHIFDGQMVTGCKDGQLSVRSCDEEDEQRVEKKFDIAQEEGCIKQLLAISSRYVLSIGTTGYLSFIDVMEGNYVDRIKVFNGPLNCFVVLNEKVIMVGSDDGSFHVNVPSRMVPHMREYLGIAPPPGPLEKMCKKIRKGKAELKHAVPLLVSENFRYSLREAFHAHQLVVACVVEGLVDKRTSYEDRTLNWYQSLYSKFALLGASLDYRLLSQILRQAVSVGIISECTLDIFCGDYGNARQLANVAKSTEECLYTLFLEHTQMKLKMDRIADYINRQQTTLLVNAVLGCIPVVGGLTTNVVSAGASILHDFQVCGLVDSLLSVGTDLYASHGKDHLDRLVGRFMKRTRQFLSPDVFNKLPQMSKLAMVNATKELNLSNLDLGALLSTGMNQKHSHANMLCRRLNKIDKSCFGEDSGRLSPDGLKQVAGNVSVRVETLTRSAVRNMDANELAELATAHLHNYTKEQSQETASLEKRLKKLFMRCLIHGMSVSERHPDELMKLANSKLEHDDPVIRAAIIHGLEMFFKSLRKSVGAESSERH